MWLVLPPTLSEPGLASSTGRCCSSLPTLHRCPAPATDPDLCRSHIARRCASSFPYFNSFPLKFLMLRWHLWLSKWLFLFSCRMFLLKCSHTTIYTLILCCNYVIKQQSSSGHGMRFQIPFAHMDLS